MTKRHCNRFSSLSSSFMVYHYSVSPSEFLPLQSTAIILISSVALWLLKTSDTRIRSTLATILHCSCLLINAHFYRTVTTTTTTSFRYHKLKTYLNSLKSFSSSSTIEHTAGHDLSLHTDWLSSIVSSSCLYIHRSFSEKRYSSECLSPSVLCTAASWILIKEFLASDRRESTDHTGFCLLYLKEL